MMLIRAQHIQAVAQLLQRNPVVAILGARQVGKTTLARQVVKGQRGPTRTFDLENPADLARLSDPMLALEDFHGLVVLDEIQRLPDLFQILRGKGVKSMNYV